MAKNREPEKPVEPESEYEESSDEGMESEPEPVEDTNNKPPPPRQPQQPSSSEEGDSESESEQNVVPLDTISMGEKQKSMVQPKPAEEENREAVWSPSKRTVDVFLDLEVAYGGFAKKKKYLGRSMFCSCGNMNDKVMSIGQEAFEAEIEIEGSKEWKKLISEEINIQLRKTQLVADFLNH